MVHGEGVQKYARTPGMAAKKQDSCRVPVDPTDPRKGRRGEETVRRSGAPTWVRKRKPVCDQSRKRARVTVSVLRSFEPVCDRLKRVRRFCDPLMFEHRYFLRSHTQTGSNDRKTLTVTLAQMSTFRLKLKFQLEYPKKQTKESKDQSNFSNLVQRDWLINPL